MLFLYLEISKNLSYRLKMNYKICWILVHIFYAYFLFIFNLQVDFQFSLYGPCNIDLTNATYLMLDSEQRLEKRMEISRFYFQNFLETLKNIRFAGELPKFSQFKMQELEYRHQGKHYLNKKLELISLWQLLVYPPQSQILFIFISLSPMWKVPDTVNQYR